MLGRSFRRIGGNVVVELTRAEARERLSHPGPWRTCNEELAKQLLGDEVMP
jgi:hypothetical protein